LTVSLRSGYFAEFGNSIDFKSSIVPVKVLAILAGDNIYNNGEIEKINAVFERPCLLT
jgi:hypothetical protein